MTTKSRIPVRAPGIISIDHDLTTEEVERITAQFKAAMQLRMPIVTGPGITYTAFPKPKPSIRPSWADRGHRYRYARMIKPGTRTTRVSLDTTTKLRHHRPVFARLWDFAGARCGR